MTQDLRGALHEIRAALSASVFFMKERDVLRDTRVNNEKALAKLDAILAAVPDGLLTVVAIKSALNQKMPLDSHTTPMESTMFQCAALLQTITEKDDGRK